MPDSPDQQAGAEDEPAALSAQILALLAKLTERFDSAENEEWRWLIAHSPSPLIVEILRDADAYDFAGDRRHWTHGAGEWDHDLRAVPDSEGDRLQDHATAGRPGFD